MQRDLKFYSELKQMNLDLIDYLKRTNEVSPHFDFSPTCEDYVSQMTKLLEKYPEVPATSTTNSTTTSTTFSTISSTTTTANQPFLFGAPIASSSSTLNTFFSFVPPPSVASSTSASASVDASADDEVHEPPEPKIDKFEEPNAKHSVKCKLYEREKGKDNELSLAGIGTLYVKALDTPNKQQVIIRQEPDLRRVLLNEVVSSNIPVKLLPKAVQIVFPGSIGDNKFYIVKVKDEMEANKLYDTLKMNKI